MEITPIAYIKNDYKEKFGIPRQSGIIDEVVSRIIFEKEYKREDALKGLEDYDYIWLIFGFSKNHERPFCATVKPPRLGGHERMGVFATRSPFRPNNLGLSSVRLIGIEDGDLLVKGADLLDNTPIYDIKPYVAFSDAHMDARSGFVDERPWTNLKVDFPKELLERIPVEKQEALLKVLSQDPRPAYDRGIDREYKLAFGKWDISFEIKDEIVVVTFVGDYIKQE
ncbi:MAG: tRNA (N6-threonylcarbamoyladenosine(37)-N6)-methyltransferase TrmO [Lachnospiraceae bacterium]|nr:tRNA (N6-threonylcarbamoyladenosine(37)-N6)-methyltransferase TrmO [Lachnospiraceae bacterium]